METEDEASSSEHRRYYHGNRGSCIPVASPPGSQKQTTGPDNAIILRARSSQSVIRPL